MLFSILKNLCRRGRRASVVRTSAAGPLRLHVGGKFRHPDWTIVDMLPGPHVDCVASCTDLTAFDDASVTEIYASHVLEHLGYMSGLAAALREFHRVLVPGGTLCASVPDLGTLCALFLEPHLVYAERFHVMRIMFGGQLNEADFHYVGLNEEFLRTYLQQAGFVDIVRVTNFGIFDDSSSLIYKGRPVSLNLRASKPHLA